MVNMDESYIDNDSGLYSDDSLVRIEAKLDMLISLLTEISEGMGRAMEGIVDSPLGRMLGKLAGADKS